MEKHKFEWANINGNDNECSQEDMLDRNSSQQNNKLKNLTHYSPSSPYLARQGSPWRRVSRV